MDLKLHFFLNWVYLQNGHLHFVSKTKIEQVAEIQKKFERAKLNVVHVEELKHERQMIKFCHERKSIESYGQNGNCKPSCYRIKPHMICVSLNQKWIIANRYRREKTNCVFHEKLLHENKIHTQSHCLSLSLRGLQLLRCTQNSEQAFAMAEVFSHWSVKYICWVVLETFRWKWQFECNDNTNSFVYHAIHIKLLLRWLQLTRTQRDGFDTKIFVMDLTVYRQYLVYGLLASIVHSMM